MSKIETLIKTKKAKIAVVGLGYVGLPLAVAFAERGFRVFGFDVQKKKVDQVNQGKSYIEDIKSADLAKVVKSKPSTTFPRKVVLGKRLSATTDKKILGEADVIIICVPTPLDKYHQPDISYIESITQNIAQFLKKGQLIILESTTYPGTTREVILPFLEKTGLKVGRDFFLAFSPERIDPGNKKYNVKNIPKVVGGITPKCTKSAALLYRTITNKVMTVSSPEVAEMTKLLENIFRLVNISMIYELALLCDKMKIDIWEVIEAAKTKPYGFMPFYPGPGCGGHCIAIDPFYLLWKAKEYGFYARFIELAGQINEQMPHYVVTKIIFGLNKNKKSVKGSKILIWGISYKKDIADTRESAAYPIISDLLRKGAEIDYFDPYTKEFKISAEGGSPPKDGHSASLAGQAGGDGKILKSIKYNPKILKNYDCVLILADHSGFNYDEIAKSSKLVVDTRNAIKTREYKNVLWL